MYLYVVNELIATTMYSTDSELMKRKNFVEKLGCDKLPIATVAEVAGGRIGTWTVPRGRA